jgi:hypothetical protein
MQYAPPVYNEYVLDLRGRAIAAVAPGTTTVAGPPLRSL